MNQKSERAPPSLEEESLTNCERKKERGDWWYFPFFFLAGWKEFKKPAERAKKVLTHRDLLSERSDVVSWSKLSLLVSKLKSADRIFSSLLSILFFLLDFILFRVWFRARGRLMSNTSGCFRFRLSLYRNGKVYLQHECCTNRINDFHLIRYQWQQ